MTSNLPSQYETERNLVARQRLWRYRDPPFDLVGWVLKLTGLAPGDRVLDVGCGNGAYLAAMAGSAVNAVGADLSVGMLRSAAHRPLVAADAVALPFRDGVFDVVLAPHMLYHVPDRTAAVGELRRVLTGSGVCIAVTNGETHLASLWTLVEDAVHTVTPAWRMRDPASGSFSLENGAEQLASAFDQVRLIRPDNPGRVVITDARVVADYVASVADFYQQQVGCPWQDIVDRVRRRTQQIIDRDGAFVTAGDVGALVCR